MFRFGVEGMLSALDSTSFCQADMVFVGLMGFHPQEQGVHEHHTSAAHAYHCKIHAEFGSGSVSSWASVSQTPTVLNPKA